MTRQEFFNLLHKANVNQTYFEEISMKCDRWLDFFKNSSIYKAGITLEQAEPFFYELYLYGGIQACEDNALVSIGSGEGIKEPVERYKHLNNEERNEYNSEIAHKAMDLLLTDEMSDRFYHFFPQLEIKPLFCYMADCIPCFIEVYLFGYFKMLQFRVDLFSYLDTYPKKFRNRLELVNVILTLLTADWDR